MGTVIWWFYNKGRGIAQKGGSLEKWLRVGPHNGWVKEGDKYVSEDGKWIAFSQGTKNYIWEKIWYDDYWLKHQ
ncbi:MAG: hypothetical protein HRT89_06930 [Lentisphaeria bacterium]|nr:hypothetical protein [Lentisphaeria bacterium]